MAANAPHSIMLQTGHGPVRLYAKQEGNVFDMDLDYAYATGERIAVGFNGKMLLAALRVVTDTAEMVLELSGEKSLARIRVERGTYAVMPLDLTGATIPARQGHAPEALPEQDTLPEPAPVHVAGVASVSEPEEEPMMPTPDPQPAPVEVLAEAVSEDEVTTLVRTAQELVSLAQAAVAHLLASA